MKVVDQIINIEDETAGGFKHIGLSESGALIAASTATGSIYVYLTELNVLGSACGSRLAFLRHVYGSLFELFLAINRDSTIVCAHILHYSEILDKCRL